MFAAFASAVHFGPDPTLFKALLISPDESCVPG
jgi:hypothetical protein